MLRKKKSDLDETLPEHLRPQLQKIRQKYLDLRHYNYELLVELVVRGYLRDEVTEDKRIVTHLKVRQMVLVDCANFTRSPRSLLQIKCMSS